jgi:glycosyltransferase involved in cell wall biosynthesis
VKKILSICIPTFNRHNYLDKLLGNVQQQLVKYQLQDDVEVIVSDNASEDDTSAVAQKYASVIRYNRNEKNIGPDANFLLLFGMAQGEYIWLPGDDDEIRMDTIAYIVKSIHEIKFDFLYLKTEGAEIDNLQRGAEQMTNVELLTRVNIFTTFMTSQVIRADLIKEQVESARVFLGGFMAYYKVFMEALWNSSKCYVSAGKEIFANADNTGNYLFYKVWSQSVFDVLETTPFARDRKLIALIKLRMFLDLILPITYKLRSGTRGFYFLSEDPKQSMSKYFGEGLYSSVFRIYFGGPQWLLFPVNKASRVISKLHKKSINGVL